jgi:hypothetical protein
MITEDQPDDKLFNTFECIGPRAVTKFYIKYFRKCYLRACKSIAKSIESTLHGMRPTQCYMTQAGNRVHIQLTQSAIPTKYHFRNLLAIQLSCRLMQYSCPESYLFNSDRLALHPQLESNIGQSSITPSNLYPDR